MCARYTSPQTLQVVKTLFNPVTLLTFQQFLENNQQISNSCHLMRSVSKTLNRVFLTQKKTVNRRAWYQNTLKTSKIEDEMMNILYCVDENDENS